MKRLLFLLGFIIILTSCSDTNLKDEAVIKNNDETLNINKELPSEETATKESEAEEDKTEEDQTGDDLTVQADTAKHVYIKIIDESTQDESLAAFMNKLKEAVKQKNKEKLLSMLSDDIKFSFGGGYGKKDFIEEWNLNNDPKNSEIWFEMEKALSLGGDLNEDKSFYTAPYIFENFPEEYDPFVYSAVIGEKVNIREEPSVDSNVVAQLSYEIVKVNDYTDKTFNIDGKDYEWISVTTLDGKNGYIIKKFLRSSVDYRLGITKTNNGDWQIIFFIAGD